ncbi:MAG: hypothetical protein Q9160_002918 [Pyrenula sp. 1 TL-2023]
MYLVERLWGAVTTIISIVSLTPLPDELDFQHPLAVFEGDTASSVVAKGPRFHPPGAPRSDSFQCEYPDMVGWEPCSSKSNRKCWLRRTLDGKQFDIYTNYEKETPIGITRKYELELKDGSIEVNVTNKLANNGTSIHWHGIRQNQTMHMDGVNGITQCPIAPNDYFVYKFNVTQYGSSWYHSHYSVQYADGAVGSMTLHGPSSLEYDAAISPPLITTDWDQDILLNGRGNITNYSNLTKNKTAIANPYHITFEGPVRGKPVKKYLIRVINTSFDTTFVFSIDNHRLNVVSADFVPITPYKNTSLLVGIGQRCNVIVEANPEVYNKTDSLPTEGNYWIRTYIAPCKSSNTDCNGPEDASCGYERTGVLRYDSSSTAVPSSHPWQNTSLRCSDETYTDLHPILPWTVSSPINGASGQRFNLSFQASAKPPFPLAKWELSMEEDVFTPIRINYSDPTFFHLDNKGSWDPLWRIIPEDYTSQDWLIECILKTHLHGHDFAILEQAYNKTYNSSNLSLELDNPPRRDVVLMPRNGYVVIAFKADNPGAWLVHCHIAFHISEGLGLQIMERQDDADQLWPKPPKHGDAMEEAERVCSNWKAWYGNDSNWSPPGVKCPYENKEWCFQDDSGV